MGDGGPATRAALNGPSGVALDSTDDLFIADSNDNVVREVNHASGVITTVAGNGTAGYSGDGGPATAAELSGPQSITLDSAGDLFIADTNNDVIREVNHATGVITTVAGNGYGAGIGWGGGGYSGDGGAATAAELNSPSGVALDTSGDLFIADNCNNVIREVNHATGVITTVAGNGTAGYSGDGGPATAAELNGPNDVAVDATGDLFIADPNNNVIREVNLANGQITTVAGNYNGGNGGYSGDGGPATAAELSFPLGVAVDTSGDLFIADNGNNVIREVNHATGVITTVAGNYNGGNGGYSGDGGPATAAELNSPNCVASDTTGDLFIADNGNNVIREVAPPNPLIVDQADTTTSVSTSTTSISFSESVTLTATVAAVALGTGTPTGNVDFIDTTHDTDLGTASLSSGSATLTTSFLAVGTDTIEAIYSGDANFHATGSTAASTSISTSIQVSDVNTDVTLQASSNADAQNAVKAVNELPSHQGDPITVTLTLAAGTYHDLYCAPPAGVTLDVNGTVVNGIVTIQGASPALTVGGLGNVVVENVNLTTPTSDPTVVITGGSVTLQNDNVQTTGAGPTLSQTSGIVTLQNDTVQGTGAVPTISQSGGVLSLQNDTVQSTGAAPTVSQSGGNLTLRNSTVQSTGNAQTAISVSGGTVDLGTPDDPGSNILNVSSTGQFVQNTTGNSLSASGNTYQQISTVDGSTIVTTCASNLSFTSVTTTASSVQVRQSVTLTATVIANSGLDALTGSVDFVDTTTNTDLGSVALDNNGVATLANCSLAVGSHAILAKYSGDANFTPSLDRLTQTFTAIPLTIKLNDASKTYGAADPVFTVSSYAGFLNGDTPASLGGTLVFTTNEPLGNAPVGSYLIMASGLTSADYAITYVPGTLTVNQAALTITANSESKVYGAALPTLTASYSGFVNGETAASLTTAPAISTTATVGSQVGSYPITASSAVDPNYCINYVASTLAVTPATLTVTANSTSKVYGSANPTFSDTITGYVNGDTSSVVSGSASLTTTATAASSVASYTITAALGSLVASNYGFSFVNGTLAVTPATLTVTANSTSKVYGSANPTFSDTITGYVNGDTSASLTTQPTLTTSATVASQVGSYPITASGAIDADYTISYKPGTLSITQCPTTAAVSSSLNPSMYGQSVTFTATVSNSMTGNSFVPTGSVQFVIDGSNYGSAMALNGNGLASITDSTLSASGSPHTVTVNYLNSDGNFKNSTASLPGGETIITVTPGSIYALDPTAGGALSLSGNASINTSGNVVVDSSSGTAILASGNATVAAATVQVVGGVSKSGNAKVTKTGTPAAPGDPLAGLPIPVASTLGLGSKGSLSLSGNSSQTIVPGVYSQICVSGNASLTLNPGIYIIAGGGFVVSGNGNIAVAGSSSSLTGTGVMIYNAGKGYSLSSGADSGTFGAITLSGNGTMSLIQPSTGTYSGVLIFQARDNPTALTFSGNAMQGITGTIYASAAQLAESGNAQIGSAAHPISLVVDTLSLSGNAIAQLAAGSDASAYTPAQIRTAYGINDLALDGTGQTIAIVDAYDDPQIYQALDVFDSQFGLTNSGPTLYQQYGPATSFLSVLNQNGQPTSLPGTDPAGQGNDNWEVETALDVQWVHAIAPAAKIVLVEANSQSLPDLMTAAATAASQPGVSTVSMSWGFAEGQGISAAQEAAYDQTFAVPGVTFVASTGDYGAADPVYPAFSPNVLAVGGTSLTLNADNSYNGETGWGYYSDAFGSFIGSGGGLSQYESEPAYQQRVQSTGSRTTPDVSFVADPATGAWIADPYNLDPSNPWEVVGGTSLSAPCWSGLIALVNQGRSAAGQAALNSSSPTETQQAVYSLSQNDYHVITSGSNGYTAAAGYNLVTGLGTPVANLLVPDLIAGSFPATGLVPPASAAALVNLGTTGGNTSGTANVMNVFSALTVVGSTDSSSLVQDTLARATSERISQAHDAVLQRRDLATSQNELALLWGWTEFQNQRHSSGVPDGFASAVDKVFELS